MTKKAARKTAFIIRKIKRSRRCSFISFFKVIKNTEKIINSSALKSAII
jgi:hypothetical protein